MGVQLSWQSTCFASRMSSVRDRLPPPFFAEQKMPRRIYVSAKAGTQSKFTWACSSVGQSASLIRTRSLVRFQVRPPSLISILFYIYRSDPTNQSDQTDLLKRFALQKANFSFTHFSFTHLRIFAFSHLKLTHLILILIIENLIWVYIQRLNEIKSEFLSSY